MIMSLVAALHHVFYLVYWFMDLKLSVTTVKNQTRTKEEEDNILQWSNFVLFNPGFVMLYYIGLCVFLS